MPVTPPQGGVQEAVEGNYMENIGDMGAASVSSWVIETTETSNVGDFS